MIDGVRTHDNRNHNPGLYQLSYDHHRESYNRMVRLAHPAGLEPATLGLEGRCSIQLSYEREVQTKTYQLEKVGRNGRIRTYDPLVPNQMRYRAALRSELCQVQHFHVALLRGGIIITTPHIVNHFLHL